MAPTFGFSFRELRKGFFDTAAVMAAVDKKTRGVMSRAGSFIRTRARSSIRKRKEASPPGKPPSSHAGQLRLIFFAFDESSKSMVVGPIAFKPLRLSAGIVPGLHEFGGTVAQRGRRLRYPPRPFMEPAARAELPKFAGLFGAT